MSLRLEMLQVARLAPKVLGPSTELVRDFLLQQQNPDGGFKDRTGRSDLYYTVFGLDALLALQAGWPQAPVEKFLRAFGDGDGLDFVHLCCLARCRAALANAAGSFPSGALAAKLRERIESFRTEDGGYHPLGGKNGTVYGGFLALGAFQDLRIEILEPLRLARSLKFLETPDGAWANERGLKSGSTNATAAAITLLRNLSLPVHQSAGDWLLARSHPEGGFLAMAQAPMPDLLSTATALHALSGMEMSFERIKEPCLDFIDSLWTNQGSFHGHWNEEILDCEYTFYALLALGHLSF